MRSTRLLCWSAVYATAALAQSLQSVLLDNGFTSFAGLLEGHPVHVSGYDLIVYVPSDAAIQENSGNSLARRDVAGVGYYISSIKPQSSVVTTTHSKTTTSAKITTTALARLTRDVEATCGAVRETWLNDPALVNLGPGRNQTLVEKNVCAASRPLVFTGRGASVKVTADDIPFDRGVLRPISGVFTLPRTLSETLPFLGTSRFLEALDEVGLLAELDSRTAITILAPTDAAFKRETANITGAQLVDVLKNHVLVGTESPAYTPLIQGGQVFSTLSGGSLTTSVLDDVISFGDAQVSAGDTIIKIGVVHTISKVLTAASLSGTPSPTSGPSSTVSQSPIVTAAAAIVEPTAWKASFALIALVGAAQYYFA
ncbi:FAS1 domain-containing protein [Lasiosphaeris hirsuta]|uniref:FAS1 domain-containing protein n=1 Tax=Lasiosphaeris hirsuta TaxID=260670 RepID=A0AA39ZSJ0_9PEZI|nr:FAS1 domain-containing protein [Lasiosphaeris hirsuta]